MGIAQNVMMVRKRIEEAAARAGRRASEVTVVYATKYATARQVAELLAIEKGRVAIGENRVYDALEKFRALRGMVCKGEWRRFEKHFIGTIQSNKMHDVAREFDVVESVGSLKHAEKLDREAEKACKKIPVFLEVNAGLEASKHGFRFGEIDAAVGAVGGLGNLKLAGLMTMAPLAGPEVTRPVFNRLRKKCGEFGLLASMGMSNDFEIAIEEGADLVRIGSAVFKG